MDEPNVQTEVDRYIGWPGQLEILKLREEARQKLGEKFDIRAFHDGVIGNGPLPLMFCRDKSRFGLRSKVD